jgi:TolB-like protein/Tfp pilus assembly protein PilF
MPDKPGNPFSFFQELKRRKVVRVIIVYAAASFVILELASIIQEPFGLPDWTIKLIFVILCVGLIISIILSWIYDVTPHGIEKTLPVRKIRKEDIPVSTNRWKIATYISIVVIIGLVVFHIVNRLDSVDLNKLEKTVAVLPFENLGPIISTTSLHDAIPIALTMELRTIEGFKVPSWRSTSKYKETNMKMPDIGIELGVNYLLLGSVQELQEKVRVDIEFIHAASEDVIWSRTEEMELSDIFHVQRNISHRVATSLRSNLSDERDPITDHPDAYLAYLTGVKYYHSDETEITFRQAMEHFNKAVQFDSNFIQAHVKLSTSHSWMYQLHYDRTLERLFLAKKAFEKAYEIDPYYPDIRLARGLYHYVKHEYKKARDQYEMVHGQVVDEFELNMCIGSLYRRESELSKAAEYFLKAAEADPQSRIPRLELAETSLLLREYELAEQYYNQYVLMGGSLDHGLVNLIDVYLLWNVDTERSRLELMELKSSTSTVANPYIAHYGFTIYLIDNLYDEALSSLDWGKFEVLDDQFAYLPRSLYVARVYRLQNNTELAYSFYDSARKHLEEMIDQSPQDSRYHSSLGISYAGLGKKSDAIKEAEIGVNLMPLEKDYYRGIFRLKDAAIVYTMVGEYERALVLIDQLLSMPSLLSANLLKKDPIWKPLWDHPDFNRLIEKYAVN